MRVRPIKKSWVIPSGKHILVDEERTLRTLEELCTHDQNKDAYWEAIDILKEEDSLCLSDKDYWDTYFKLRDKLLKLVKNEVGYINCGEFLINGTNNKNGIVWWEKRNKEDCIRWALADFILY